MPETYDMAIIGGGPGGYSAALRASRLGLSVVLAEKDRLGGVCLNRGCIPTKALLSDVHGISWAQQAYANGILQAPPQVDFPHLMDRKSSVVQGLVSNLGRLLDTAQVKVINQNASMPEPGVIRFPEHPEIHSRNTLIATGSRPWTPLIPGIELDRVLGTRKILELDSVPRDLVIIGGGVIAQEFAAIFSALGTSVTVLEILDHILDGVDHEIRRRYSALLPGRGIKTQVGAEITCIERFADRLRVQYVKNDKEKALQADYVLVATGRRPNIDYSVLSGIKSVLDGNKLPVDRYLSTRIQSVYAVGDVLGTNMLAHVASFQGEIVAENIAGSKRPFEREVVPCCIFTSPEIAWVGITEDQARSENRPIRTSVFPLSASGKAVAVGKTRGLLKLIEDSSTNSIIGAHFMGPNVSELVGAMTLAIRKKMSAGDIADTIWSHPTISEALREAAMGFLDGPIHAAARIKSF